MEAKKTTPRLALVKVTIGVGGGSLKLDTFTYPFTASSTFGQFLAAEPRLFGLTDDKNRSIPHSRYIWTVPQWSVWFARKLYNVQIEVDQKSPPSWTTRVASWFSYAPYIDPKSEQCRSGKELATMIALASRPEGLSRPNLNRFLALCQELRYLFFGDDAPTPDYAQWKYFQELNSMITSLSNSESLTSAQQERLGQLLTEGKVLWEKQGLPE